MLVSSIMKKGSTSTIITFVILAVIITAFSLVLNAANVDSWWMIDQAAGSIETCSQEYRNMMNEMYKAIGEMLANPTTFIDKEYYVPALVNDATYEQLITALLTPTGPNGEYAWNLGAAGAAVGQMEVVEPNYVRDVLVMIGWGVITMVGAFFAFLRREF